MKDTQKRFLGAVLAASSVVGIVAPSVTAMATVQEDEEKATAEELRAAIKEYTGKLEQNPIFANYHRVEYAADRLAKYDAVEAEAAKQAIIKYADKVYTTEVKTILDKMGEFASSKSMATYDELVNKDIKAMENKEDSQYLMGRLTVWGTDFIFAADTNYSKATDAIIAVGKLVNAGKYEEAGKLVPAAKEAIKNIKTYEVNGAYLEAQLKEYEDIIAEKASLKVVSAEAINATEIKVVFNREVDEDSAEAISNYTVYTGTDSNKTMTFNANLQDDNKTVLLQLDKALENGSTYNVEAKNVLDTTGKKVEAYKGNATIFNDKTAPVLVKTEYVGSNVKFTFNKPLSEMPTVKIDNLTVNYDKSTYTSGDNKGKFKSFSTDAGEYELNVAITGDANKKAREIGNHTVKISGAKDYAENTADMITTEYNATEENEKPTVKSVEADSDRAFKVEFNSDLRKAKFEDGSLEIKKGNHTFKAGTDFTISKYNEEDKDYTVTFVDSIVNDGDNPLYEEDDKNVQLDVKITDVYGANDKKSDDFTTKITLEKDKEAPEVKDSALNRVETVDDQDYLVLLFNEDLNEVAGDVYKNNITVVRDGSKQKVTHAFVTGKKLMIQVNNESKLQTGSYKISLEKGVVTDKAKNKNEALTTTLNYKNENSSSFQLASDTVDVKQDKNKNIVTIDFGKEMDSSALDAKNYRIDGVTDELNVAFLDASESSKGIKDSKVEIEIPRGSISDNATDVRITLEKDLTAKTGEYLATSSDDKAYIITSSSKTEETVKAAILTATSHLEDDTDPAMTDIELVKKDNESTTTETNVLKITFDEKIKLDKGKALDDFVVRDSSKNQVHVKNAEVTPAGDAIVLRLEKTVSLNKAITVEVTNDPDFNKDKEMGITDDAPITNKIKNELATSDAKSSTTVIADKDLYTLANLDVSTAQQLLTDAKTAAAAKAQALTDATTAAAAKAQALTDATTAAAAKAQALTDATTVAATKAQALTDATTAAATKATELQTAITNKNTVDADGSSTTEQKNEADQAVKDATTAKATADQAVKDATTAKATADQAVTDATTAKTTADQAVTDATTAKATADKAVTDATTAKATADQAVVDAQAALDALNK